MALSGFSLLSVVPPVGLCCPGGRVGRSGGGGGGGWGGGGVSVCGIFASLIYVALE